MEDCQEMLFDKMIKFQVPTHPDYKDKVQHWKEFQEQNMPNFCKKQEARLE